MRECDEDQWVSMAMADDSLVADLLLRLRLRQLSASLHWTVRQRRTTRWHDKKTESTRASPTTPLLWTAATSVDGYEGSSRPTMPLLHASQSKAVAHGKTATVKKSRKKRTLADLQYEQKLLMKEKKILKKKLASLYITVEKQKAMNEGLKKMKLDLMSQQSLKIGKAVYYPPQCVEAHWDQSESASAQTVQGKVLDDELAVCAASASSKQPEIGTQKSSFLLPDLNLPLVEDFHSIDVPELS